MAEKLLVFGPAGNVGRQILPHVIGNSKFEVCLAYHRNRPPQCDDPGVQSTQVSLHDLDSVKRALSWLPARIVFMVSTSFGTLPMAQNFVAACKAVSPGVKQVVYVSESDCDEFYCSQTAFYKEHMDTVRYMMESGLPLTRMEPAFFMQNIEGILAAELGKGTGTVSIGVEPTTPIAWVDTRDIGEAVARVLERDAGQETGRHHRLVGDYRSMREMTDILCGVLNECESEPKASYPQKLEYEQATTEEYSRRMEEGGMEAGLAKDLAFISSTLHERHFPISGVDSSREMDELLGRASIGLRQFLRDNKPVWEKAWASGEGAA